MIVKLQHLQDLPEYKSEQPYELYGYPTPNSPPHSNFVHELCEVDLVDARGKESQYNIDTQGFTWVKHQSKYELLAEHFESAEHGNAVVSAYLEETNKLVQQHMGVEQVCVMDWRVSRSSPSHVMYMLNVIHSSEGINPKILM